MQTTTPESTIADDRRPPTEPELGPSLTPSDEGRERWSGGAQRALRRALALGGVSVDAALIGGLAWVLGRHAGAFSGFPKGFDAWGHFSRVHLLMVHFPHLGWNDVQYSGVAFFRGSYPPLYHVLIALAALVSGASIPSVMVTMAAVSVVVTAVCFYGFVRLLTRSRAAGIVSAVLLLATPAYWALILDDGMYPRLMGIACMSVALLGAALCLRRSSRWWLVLTIAATAGALSSHPFEGVTCAVLVAAILAFGPALSGSAAYDRTRTYVIGTAALAAYYYLPLLLDHHVRQLLLPYPPLSLTALFWPARGVEPAGYIHVLSPLMLPACAAIGGSLTVLARRSGLGRAARGQIAVAGVCTAFALAWFAYARVGAWHLDYINGLSPSDTLVFIGLLLAGACGLGLGALVATVAGSWRRRSILLVGVLLAGLSAAVTGSLLPGASHDYNDAGKRSLIATFPPAAASQHGYRIAGAVDYVTNWINAVYDVPQVRGYPSQSIVNLDWQVWLEDALKEPSWPAPEREFLLDWYGIKWVYAGPDQPQLRAYDANPRSFTLLGAASVGPPFRVYRYERAGAILAARSTRTVLVFGDQSHYDTTLRSIARVGESSEGTILIQGGPVIDAYTAQQLAQFDAVLLYGASAEDPTRAARVLAGYVRGGGGLIVDSGDNRRFIDDLARRGAPIPVKQTIQYQAKNSWGMNPQGTAPVRGVQFGKFSPPLYNGYQPWAVATAIRLQPWAAWDLAAGTGMVMASGRYGAGNALWLGMNLPFHISVFRNPVESSFLVRILRTVARRPPSTPPTYTAHFVNGGRREITVTGGATGVLLKETASNEWHATVNGRETQIYRAGPGMMYVPLGSDRRPASVVFEYRTGMPEWLGRVLSVLAGLALLLVGLGPRARARARARRARRRGAPAVAEDPAWVTTPAGPEPPERTGDS
jgi:hypothetical protein